MNNTEATTTKFDRIMSLEDAKRRARAAAVFTDRPTAQKDAAFVTAAEDLDQAIGELSIDEVRAYCEYRKA